MIVKDIMVRKLVTVDCNESVTYACNKYRDYKVGCLIVTDKNHIVGMVTERDFIERTICNEKDPKTTKVKEIMSSDVITIDPYDEIDTAIEKLKEYKIKKLPVVDGDELVGIVTITDIAHTRPTISKFLKVKKI